MSLICWMGSPLEGGTEMWEWNLRKLSNALDSQLVFEARISKQEHIKLVKPAREHVTLHVQYTDSKIQT